MTSKKLYALQIETSSDFHFNLKKLITEVAKCDDNSIILAPEVYLSGFSYERMIEASEFAKDSLDTLKHISKEKTIALTMIEEEKGGFVNCFYVFEKGKIVYRQRKNKLFPLGDEHNHFIEGSEAEMRFFELDGIKCAAILCFELRFVHLWEKVKGADLIFVPAAWGKERKDHFESLTKSLAIANQCYVLASDSSNEKMAKGSGIISPFGKEIRDDSKEIIEGDFDPKQIETMRRYIDVGL